MAGVFFELLNIVLLNIRKIRGTATKPENKYTLKGKKNCRLHLI